ncbi:RraA-like protein [Rozella allomycis CSF55]|uniref:RraA-like protein n=1 Tax=Rozella allomycis (strain CSF55) TaxID=988480 RepID=A0A4P9YC23_ROZAC|nr:RraA-like protein [Rozella allomycis CSF55]
MKQSIAKHIAGLSTCDISDAFYRLNVAAKSRGGYIPHLRPLNPIKRISFGPSFTIKIVKDEEMNLSLVPKTQHFLDLASTGSVLVAQVDPGCTNAIFGGLMTRMATHKGLCGLVTNGRIRDVDEVSMFPIICGGISSQGPKPFTKVESVCLPIEVNETSVYNGDFIFLDINGALSIPVSMLDDVIVMAQKIKASEKSVEISITKGETFTNSIKHRH